MIQVPVIKSYILLLLVLGSLEGQVPTGTIAGIVRIAEPHDHGILNGSAQLLSWQVAGRSSRRLPNWLLTKVDEITDLVMLDQTFPGGRPTAAGKHIKWDVLFIRVKPAKSQLHVVPKRHPG